MASSYHPSVPKQESVESTSSTSESSKSSLVGPKAISAEFYASSTPAPQRPYQYRPISEAESSKWPDICRRTAHLLQGWKFQFQSVDMLNVKLGNSTGLQPRIQIGVSSTKDHSYWKEIIGLLSKELSKDTESAHIGVDIESPNPNSIFVIMPDHPFVATWSGLRDKVLSSLHGYEWRAVDVFLYGETSKTAEPTVFITMEERQSDEWSEIRRRIQQVVGVDVKVEKREGNVQALGSRINGTNSTGSHPHQAYANPLHNGWGIGVDSRPTGTLGGFITLRDKRGETFVYGLTTYHVVRPEMRNFPASIDRGSKTRPWPLEFQYVYSSSDEDFEEEKRLINLQLHKLSLEWRCFPLSPLRNFPTGPPLTDEERLTIEYLTNRDSLLQSRRQLLGDLADADRRVGKVAFYGGYRVKNDIRLDWALVEVPQSRIGLNRLPRSEDLPSSFVLQQDRIHKVGDMLEEKPGLGIYFKIGRTTGLTVGECNGIKSDTQLEVPLNDEDQGEQKRVVFSQAHVLMAPPDSVRPFALAGDSGAWICDRFGWLVGMVWAGADRTSYCTPIGRIIEDIEDQTGMRVELP